MTWLTHSRLIRPPLLNPVGLPSAAAGLTVTFEDSTTSDGQTITAPATISAGDLLVMHDIAASALGVSDVIPTGWTGIATYTASLASQNWRFRSSYKIAVGDEDGDTITGLNSLGGYKRKSILQFVGSAAFGSATISTPTWQATAGTPSEQTIAMSGQSVPIIGFGYWCGGTAGAVDPRTMSDSDGEVNFDTTVYEKYKIFDTAPDDVTIDMDDEGVSNFLNGMYIIPAE